MSLGTTILFEPTRNSQAIPVTQNRPFPVKISASETSQFGEVLAASRTPIIELNSSYGVTLVRDVIDENGTGSIASAGTGEILISTGTTANSTCTLRSGERGRYIPGYGAQAGVGIRVPTAATGEQIAYWGLFETDLSEGIGFGIDSGGMFTIIRRNSTTDEKTYQANWNLDKGDGTGESGVNLDMTQGNIFQVDFTWYGYGQILFGVLQVVDGYQQFVPLHQYRPEQKTSILTPNLPVTVYVDNVGTAADFDVYVGGRQYSIIGDYVPKFRFIGQENVGVSTSTSSVPLVTFRNKTAFIDRSLRLDGYGVDVSSADCIIEFYLNATLTGTDTTFANPTNATASETATEVNTAATGFTGGILIYSAFAKSGQGTNTRFGGGVVDFDIPDDQPITMAARTVAGTGSIDAFFRLREEW